MKSFIQIAVATTTVLAATVSFAAGPIAIGTNPQGSLAYVSGSAIANVVGDTLDRPFTVVPLGGPTAVIPALLAGEFEFGFANISAASAAFDGTGPFKGRPQPDLRIAAVVYPLSYGVLVSDASDIKTVADLKGKKIPSEFTSQRSNAEQVTTALALAGLDYSNVQPVPVQGGAESVKLLMENSVDAALFSVGAGIVAQADATIGVHFLSLPNDDAAQAITSERLKGSSIQSLPAGYAPGIKSDTNVFQAPFVVITGADVSDDTVYDVVKALSASKARLSEVTTQFKDMSLDAMGTASLPVPYHPGAIRFYQEQGLWKP